MTDGLAGRAIPGGHEVLGPGGVVVALRPNDWETRFFGRRMGRLEVDGSALTALPPAARVDAVSQAASAADRAGYRLVQACLEVTALETAAALEGAGFRLVDSRFEFFTRLDRRRLPRLEPPFGTTGLARGDDRASLLRLAHEGLTTNPGFHSRYKNPEYFTSEETARWFAAWVENGLDDPESLTAVWRVESEPVAFFGLARRADWEGLPHYQSTVTAAAPAVRGHKAQMFLQTTLLDAMPTDEVWMRQVTQLGNTPVFRNNFLLGRRLDRIGLVFFRPGPGSSSS
jgi:hypothetical protein